MAKRIVLTKGELSALEIILTETALPIKDAPPLFDQDVELLGQSVLNKVIKARGR